ncbi:MAG: hypothetical protein FWG04_04615 [Desulfovibrionaceae bacterium]|nr:hypothetical protein [Desulfovibrionaceae bacterium]
MRVAYRNFTGGEVSPNLSARYDLGKYAASCRYIENFLPELHGPLRRRMGTYFLEDLGGPAVLLPFQFSSDPAQNYVLVVQEGQIRIAQRGGFVRDAAGNPVTIAAPYTEAELYDLDYAQSGDLMYLAHTSHALRKVSRYGHADWRIAAVSFAPPLPAPASVTVGFSGSAGGYELRYKVVAVNAAGAISNAARGVQPSAKHPSDWVVGDYAMVYWSAVAGAVEYNVYRQHAGVYGLVGVADTTSFRDDNYVPDAGDTPPERQNPFVQGNNPGTVCFHQQRLVLGSPALEPQKWYSSRTGNYEEFSKSKPLKDDDMLEFAIASGRIDRIQWVASFGDLLIGTSGSEYKAIGADQGVVTPSSISVREQSYWGSIKIRPLIIGNSVLHVQRQGSRVRDLFYSLERDGYAGSDLSVMASHLFDDYMIRQWEYQQSPGSTVWAVRNDGVMLALVYMKEHDIWGWTRVTTQGRYLSVACTAGYKQDDLYVVVEREAQGEKRWYLEMFQSRWNYLHDDIKDAFYVDAGLSYAGEPTDVVFGLDHLEGKTVSVLADGSPEADRVVAGGKITLADKASVIHVGLPYCSLMCPQTPEADAQNGATLGKTRTYGKSLIGVIGSVTGQYGPAPDRLYDIPAVPEQYDLAVQPESRFVEFMPNCDFSPEGRIWFAQNKPLPFTISSLVLDVDIQG